VEIIDLSTAGLTAYDPATGKVNWDAPFSWGNKPLRSVASPVAVGDLFIAVTGDGAGDRFAAGIKPGEKPTIIWQNKSSKLAPYVPCPIAVGKHLFWVTDQGKLECVNPLTGKPVWSESVFSSSVSASPILLGDKLLMIDERGKAVVCKADPNGFEKVSTSEVGEPVFATPAAANGKLYIRTPTAILCIGKK
jgi:outer membrane protein assembly factor BamB